MKNEVLRIKNNPAPKNRRFSFFILRTCNKTYMTATCAVMETSSRPRCPWVPLRLFGRPRFRPDSVLGDRAYDAAHSPRRTGSTTLVVATRPRVGAVFGKRTWFVACVGRQWTRLGVSILNIFCIKDQCSGTCHIIINMLHVLIHIYDMGDA
jgi:hypothetical protein